MNDMTADCLSFLGLDGFQRTERVRLSCFYGGGQQTNGRYLLKNIISRLHERTNNDKTRASLPSANMALHCGVADDKSREIQNSKN